LDGTLGGPQGWSVLFGEESARIQTPDCPAPYPSQYDGYTILAPKYVVY